MRDSMAWVGTGGGPLIVIPAEFAPLWRGGEEWSPPRGPAQRGGDASRFRSDYDRACAVDDYLGSLNVGVGRALILGDEPMMTAFVPQPAGGLLVRWMYGEDDGAVSRAVCAIPVEVWKTTPHQLPVGWGEILVFDSAYPGDALPVSIEGGTTPWLRIALPQGNYHIDTAVYCPDESTSLVLHRLRGNRD
ncbi:Imm21 family immunity protein [Paludisphaera borealis]|uniref:Imm21 family immunity protein n=1 Tax=Paludisphaera borealis TaxID=1387353 RepID=UPI0035A3C636